MPKAFELICSELFKTGEDKYSTLLLLENIFLGLVLRAFERRPGAISPVMKSGKHASDKQSSLEKQAATVPPLSKAGRYRSRRF
jgi:hypothetical protein